MKEREVIIMFKSFGVALNNEGDVVVVAGEVNQAVEETKELFLDDGYYGAIRLDGGTGYKLMEMHYKNQDFKDMVKAFTDGVFMGAKLVVGVVKDNGEMGYLCCSDINNGNGVVYYENEVSNSIPVSEDFFNSDAEEDDRWEEYLAYTDYGRAL